jgi:hypothetical protein
MTKISNRKGIETRDYLICTKDVAPILLFCIIVKYKTHNKTRETDNAILNTGHFMHINDTSDVNNDREITLVSCFS